MVIHHPRGRIDVVLSLVASLGTYSKVQAGGCQAFRQISVSLA
jgi:hypothetical protein